MPEPQEHLEPFKINVRISRSNLKIIADQLGATDTASLPDPKVYRTLWIDDQNGRNLARLKILYADARVDPASDILRVDFGIAWQNRAPSEYVVNYCRDKVEFLLAMM